MVRIVNWDTLSDRNFSTLVVGNGFSQCFSRNFSYESLHSFAVAEGLVNANVANVFTRLNTINFEDVLDKMNSTRIVLTALGGYDEALVHIISSHDEVKNSLIESVNRLHPEHHVTNERLTALSAHLTSYNQIYTTNYDLLLYWAIMSNPQVFKDFFWGNDLSFNSENAELRTGATGIHYLHGALHLFKDRIGRVRKLTTGGDLLTSIYTSIRNDNLPLFISEGDHGQKLLKIRSNEYLSFCYSNLCNSSGNVLMFGHTLSPQFDRHLLAALRQAYERSLGNVNPLSISISIYGNNLNLAREIDLAITQNISPDIERSFFDSQSHPLGQA